MQNYLLAVAEKNGIVTSFNARTKSFAFIQIESGLIKNITTLQAPLFMSREQGMLDWLKNLNICAIVTTLASPDMLHGLQKRNVPALKASGEELEEAAKKFLKGELQLLGGCSGCKR